MAELMMFNPVESFNRGAMQGAQNALMRDEMALRQKRPELIRNALTSGNTQELFARDPQMGMKVQQYLGALGEQERAAFKERHEASLKELAFVQSLPEDQRPAAYAQVAPRINQRWGQDVLPPQYDPLAVGSVVAQGREISDILGAGKETYRPLTAQEAAARGLEGTGYQINDQTGKVSKIGGAQTTIQMPGQQKAEDAAYGKYLVEDLQSVSESAAGASEELARWQMLDAFQIPTGPGEEAKLALRDYTAKVANTMGIEISQEKLGRISDAKSYKAVTQDLLRSRLAAQKGPQTEGDAARMSQTLSQLENPAEANEFIQQANIALAKRTLEQEQFYLDYRAENGTLDGAKSAWNKFKRETPLLAKNPNTGKPVFYTEFVDAILAANPTATKEDALKLWRQKYAGAR